jgi:hypothetical protein
MKKSGTQGKIMMTDIQLEQLHRSLKRIFALPIARLSLREVQNAITTIFPGKQDLCNALYNSLLTGKVSDILSENGSPELKNLIDTYSSQVGFAREIAEMGDFMNIFNCDFFQQGNQVFFTNRMRRIDGEEYYFLSAPETNIRLAHMFINRLRDLKRQAGKDVKFDARLKEELEGIIADTQELLG